MVNLYPLISFFFFFFFLPLFLPRIRLTLIFTSIFQEKIVYRNQLFTQRLKEKRTEKKRAPEQPSKLCSQWSAPTEKLLMTSPKLREEEVYRNG